MLREAVLHQLKEGSEWTLRAEQDPNDRQPFRGRYAMKSAVWKGK